MNHKNFLSKLDEISGGRDLAPWLVSFGYTHSAVTRLRNGQPPSADLLRMLVRAERVSMKWLEEDRGAPWMVNRVVSDEEAVEVLDELTDEPGWQVTFATANGVEFALVLVRDVRLVRKSKEDAEPIEVSYRSVEVVSGAISWSTVRWLYHDKDAAGFFLRLIPDEFARLATGHMGNAELLGWEFPRTTRPGIIARRRPYLEDETFRRMLESDEEARVPPLAGLQPEESVLLAKYRQMSTENKGHAQAVVRALAHEADQEKVKGGKS